MGAKMMPMEKKSGSTVLGVRMGLLAERQHSIGWSNPGGKAMLTARPSVVAVETRYLFESATISIMFEACAVFPPCPAFSIKGPCSSAMQTMECARDRLKLTGWSAALLLVIGLVA